MVLPHIPPALTRLRVKPDDPTEGPPAIVGRRKRGPHTDATVEAVRRLIVGTTLSYREIALKTGVAKPNITNWVRDGGWQRPPFAPRANDMMPTARAGRRLKLRRLAERLRALAERMVRELEDTPGVDLDKLMQALQVVKMARIEAMGRRGRFRSPVTCHCRFPPRRVRVRPCEGRTDEASQVYGRADYRGFARTRGGHEDCGSRA
jgi:hypothetical protein